MITINKYRVNALIPMATCIIKMNKFKKDEKHIYPQNEKPKEFNGYIASFNANCIMMTPLAVSIMYSNSSSSSEDKSLVVKWIFQLLKHENPKITDTNSLIEYIEEETDENGILSRKALINVLTANNALKLAIRKFKLV